MYTTANISVIKNLTNGEAESVTIPSDGMYYVRAVNDSVAGSCSAYILKNGTYVSASSSGSGTYVRATTALIPLKAGTTIDVRALFTGSGAFCKLS